MEMYERISHNNAIMGGKPCIAGTRITVGMILMQISEGATIREILEAYPALAEQDISAALKYAAWAVGTREELEFSA